MNNLTLVKFTGLESGKPIYINPQYVAVVADNKADGGGTVIVNGPLLQSCTVRETLDQVVLGLGATKIERDFKEAL